MFVGKTIRCLSLFVRKSPLYAGLSVALEVGAALLLPLNLYLMSRLIETAVMGGVDFGIAALFAVTALVQVVISYYKKKLSLLLGFEMSHTMQRAFLEKCSRLPFEAFANEDALNLLTLAEEATDGGMMELFSGTVYFIGNVLRLGGLIFVFAMTGFALPILYLVLLFAIMMLDYKAIRLMNDMFENQSEKERRFQYYETELSDRHTLSYLRAVRGLELFRKRVTALSKELGRERIGVTVKAQKYAIFSNMMILLWFVGAIAALSFGTFQGWFSLSIFVVCISALSTALDVSEQISVGISGLAKDVFYIDKYLEMMNLDEEASARVSLSDSDSVLPEGKNTRVSGDSDSDGKSAILGANANATVAVGLNAHAEIHGNANSNAPLIAFDNISFTYPEGETSVLNHLSFRIHRGEKVSLVGENGSGKTTITKLILGLYRPMEGQIRISGRDISELSAREIHETFSAVFQDYARFDLTLKENIALSDDVSDERVRELLKTVAMDEFIGQEGCFLGKMMEDSLELSGGQWQKLAIARALYRQDAYVLFDEPFSAVDPVSENELYQQLVRLMEERGCLLISHRLGSARLADRIIVLSEGRIAEEGTHDALMRKGGLYHRMYEEQSKWYREDAGNEDHL